MRRELGQMGMGLLLAALLLGLPMLYGYVADVGFDSSRIGIASPATFQGDYDMVATLSACHGDPAVTDRDYLTLDLLPDANMAIWPVPRGTNRAVFRFHIDADGNTATVRCMSSRSRYNPGAAGAPAGPAGADHFNLAYQWAITGGSQSDEDSAVYCDTVTATAYALAGGTTGAADANWIEESEADLRGVSYLAFYRSDSDANLTVTVDVAVQ